MSSDYTSAFDTDRPRGILGTERERPYLLGESNIEPKTDKERSTRQQIRNHIRHSLLDFQILYQKLAERDRTQIIPEAAPHQRTPPEQSPLRGGLTAMLAFAFQLEDHEKAFEESIEHGIEWAVQASGWKAEVDVTIDLERTERLDDIHERVDEEGGGGASQDDLMALLLTGRIDFEEFDELKSELFTPDE